MSFTVRHAAARHGGTMKQRTFRIEAVAAENLKSAGDRHSTLRTLVIDLRTAAAATLALAVLLCGVYPLVVWAIGQGLFPNQADGSLVRRGGIVVGSELIAQRFESPKYFHPRPSAAGEAGYDAAASSGSNLGPLSKKLLDAVKERAEAYRNENGLAPDALVPADAVTASGSGLDPHISVRNAELQASRVAHARGIPAQEMARLLAAHTGGRDLGVFGEPRVNVLKLNLALDRMQG
jgi:K+-transporting ATPase ATPase C chain